MGHLLPTNSVVYSLPGSNVFLKAIANSVDAYHKTDAQSFVIRSYAKDEAPLFFSVASEEVIDVSNLEVALPDFTGSDRSVDREGYVLKVAKAIEQCRATNGKIVLSRPVEVPMKTLHIGNSLISLRARYPQAFIYLLHSTTQGIWMGASPEVLLVKEEGMYTTMALAGTKWGEALFEQKEFDEQLTVARYILAMLEDTVVEVSDMYEHPFGPLRHLRTDFRWEDEREALEFAERLHPTPAVCGFPLERAQNFIQEVEGYDRSLYTGYLGTLTSNESAHLFVNLRCLQLFRDRALVYVGGGINALSDPEVEWEETEKKKDSVLSALHYE
ncbi:MAG: chorismate-binding protein [Flavobacteriales bacterium]|nr:chorismate-binding protein [Flavobacteriales bacterium]